MSPSSTVTASATACVACGSEQTEIQRAVNGFEIFGCRACGLRFVPPERLAKVDYDELYKATGDYASHVTEAGRMQQGELIVFSRARRTALKELEAERPATLLEVGCGVGNFLRWTERMGIRSFGIEPSSNAVAMARRNLAPETSLENGYLSHDTFPGKSFDVICAWEVLEHVSDVNAFMQVIHDRLNPGGRLYMSTPNYDSDYLWRDMGSDPRSRPPVHVSFWNSASLKRFLDRRFASTAIRLFSIPLGPAQRSGPPLARWTVYPHAMLRPRQRQTMLSLSRKD